MVVGYNTVVVWNALKFPGEQALRVSGKYVMRLAKVTVVVWNALKFPGEETVSGEDVMRLDSLVINRSNTNSIPAGFPSLFFCGCVWVGVCVLYVWVGECCGCGWVACSSITLVVYIYHLKNMSVAL